MKRLCVYQVTPTKKITTKLHQLGVIKLYKLGDKTVRAGPEDCWNWTVSLDITDNSVESK